MAVLHDLSNTSLHTHITQPQQLLGCPAHVLARMQLAHLHCHVLATLKVKPCTHISHRSQMCCCPAHVADMVWFFACVGLLCPAAP
jgi:hypothetical protein